MSYVPDAGNVDRPVFGDEYQTPTELRLIKQRITNLDVENVKRNRVFQRTFPTGASETIATGAITVDLSLATYQRFNCVGPVTWTFSLPANVPANESVYFTLLLRNAGNHAQTWPAGVKWAQKTLPELTANGVDILTFFQEYPGGPWCGVHSVKDLGTV